MTLNFSGQTIPPPTHSLLLSTPKNLSPNTEPPPILPPIYVTINVTGTILAINSEGAAILGYVAEALLGRSILDLWHPQDRERFQTELSGYLNHAQTVKQGEFRLVCQNGSVIPETVTLQPLQSATDFSLLLICQSLEPQPAVPAAKTSLAAQTLLQTEWERLLRAISQPVHHSPDLRSILRTVAAEVREILQADRVLIYQIYSNQAGSILAEALAAGCASVFSQSRASASLQQKCIQIQSSAQIDALVTTEKLPDPTDDRLLKQLGARSELVLPIVQQEQLWGVLLVHQCKRSRQWQPRELALLKQLATYLDSAIQQVELYHQVQRLNADLERQIQARTAELQLAFDFEATLKRITDKVRDSLDENQILETVVQELTFAIGISGCNASIYDLEAGTSTICYEYTANISPYQGRVLQLNAFPEIYDQLLEGQAFQFCSLMINPGRGRVSMLTCPIVDDQGVMGDLWLINHSYYCFSEQDIRLVQQVANQCAIAIRQARLYQAAQAQVKALERLNHLKDDFLSTVSHELRTPMASIKMATQMLEVVLRQEGLLAGNAPRVAKYFQILQTECRREINLINDLLDLSRLDTEHIPLHLSPIDLSTWVPALTQLFRERANSQQQQLQCQIPANLPPLMSDSSILERVVSELLQNACKYTPMGGTITIAAYLKSVPLTQQSTAIEPAIQPCLSSSPIPNPGYSTPMPVSGAILGSISGSPVLCLSVTNSGVEIPDRELTRVFEKFYRIPNNDPWQHGGTGLGLALVRKLVDHLGGTVRVESGSGKTCFMVELPLQSSG